MTVIDGDLIRTVQRATIHSGQSVSSKFYHLAVSDTVLANAEVVDKMETWLEAAYDELSLFATTDCQLNEAEIDRIGYVDGAWRTLENIGVATPSVTFSPAQPPPPGQIAALLTFSTNKRKVRRPFYQWGPREDATIGGVLHPTMVTVLILFGIVLLSPAFFDANNYLYPVTVSAARDAVHRVTGFTVTDVVTAMSRRRPV